MRLFTLLLLPALCIAAPAMADDHHHDDSHHNVHRAPEPVAVAPARFREADRPIIHKYIVDRYRPSCPPGHSRKHNGCVAMGHHRHFDMGAPLPRDVRYEPAPRDLVMQLEPARPGTEYVVADGNLLLVSIATLAVLDAIEQ